MCLHCAAWWELDEEAVQEYQDALHSMYEDELPLLYNEPAAEADSDEENFYFDYDDHPLHNCKLDSSMPCSWFVFKPFAQLCDLVLACRRVITLCMCASNLAFMCKRVRVIICVFSKRSCVMPLVIACVLVYGLELACWHSLHMLCLFAKSYTSACVTCGCFPVVSWTICTLITNGCHFSVCA